MDNDKIQAVELNDDDLGMVAGGQDLLYRGEKVNKNNLLMDDSISAQPINLIKKILYQRKDLVEELTV